MSEQAIADTAPAWAKHLLSRLDALDRYTRELWTLDDIAAHCGMAKSSVKSHIVTRADFPRAVTLPTGTRRWKRKAVEAWAERG